MNFIRSFDPPPEPQEDADSIPEAEEQEQATSLPATPELRELPKPESSPDPSSVYPTPQETDSADDQGAERTHPEDTVITASPERPDSPTTSSEDEVVFRGRNHAGKVGSKSPSRSQAGPEPVPQLDNSASAQTNGAGDAFDPSRDFISLNLSSKPGSTASKKCQARQKKRKRPKANGKHNEANDPAVQAALDDYLANLQTTNEFDGLQVDEEGADKDANMDTDMNGWATEDLQDFDNMSTSQEVSEKVSQVLSKRSRPSGVQYLVVWDEKEIDEARWILHSSLPVSATSLIEAFEEQEKKVPEWPQDDADSDSDELDEQDADEEDEDDDDEASFALDWGSDENFDENEALYDDDEFADERDLIERRKERMSDEHIARLLQKQESLGIYDSDLALFDGVEDRSVPDFISLSQTGRTSRKKSLQRSKARSRSKPTFFASEDELMLEGEDYGDFDPMDWERASLRKGKQPDGFSLQLSDSDMADQLRSAWSTDRKKKKAKKAEREELRAQGLLGKKAKTRPDLKARYGDGMGLEHLEAEFESFLFNERQAQMSLPPLDKRDRKVIHDIANLFGLKSKSQGSGKKRFPVIFKTGRTMEFDEAAFDKLRGQLNRKFFSRMESKAKKGKGPAFGRGRGAMGGGGGGFRGKFSGGYREGEVVGAGASEIGSDNRGRAMLEKMGWSKGNALGAMGSEGILMPIQHVVKNSKAGLG